MKLTLQQLEAHLWGAANILRGKTAGQDYKNYILSLMFYKRLCDQWECEAEEAIAELERQQGRAFSDAEQAVFRSRGDHRYAVPQGARWGDVKAVSVNIGETLTRAMRAVADANDELRGVFTVDWNQPAPDGSGKPLIANEVVHALVQHFDEYDLSNRAVPADVLGRAYEYLIKKFADDAGAKAGEFFTPSEVVDTLVRILEPRPGDTVYDPTGGSGGMLVHVADYLRERGHLATNARYFAQEMNWGNAAIGKINSVLHGLEADIRAGTSTITDPLFLEDGRRGNRRGLVALRHGGPLLLVAGPGARHAHQRRQAAGGPADETGQPRRAGAAHGGEHRPQQQDRHRRGASPAPLAHGLGQGGQGHRPSTGSADIRHAHPRRGVRRARLGGDGDGAPRPPDQAPAAPSATLRPGPRASRTSRLKTHPLPPKIRRLRICSMQGTTMEEGKRFLKPCLTCGHEVDMSAKVCPNCGRSNPTLSFKTNIVIWLLSAAIIGGFLFFVWNWTTETVEAIDRTFDEIEKYLPTFD